MSRFICSIRIANFSHQVEQSFKQMKQELSVRVTELEQVKVEREKLQVWKPLFHFI